MMPAGIASGGHTRAQRDPLRPFEDDAIGPARRLSLAALEHRSAIEALKLSYPQMEHYPAIRRSRAWLLGALIAILGLCSGPNLVSGS
jgi:hypothetical protein